MKLKFDNNQAFQNDAINSVINLFDGQPLQQDDFSVALNVADSGMFQTEIGYANNIVIGEDELLQNVQKVQENELLDTSAQLIKVGVKYDEEVEGYACPNFSIEMETGTGKTYVYIKTALRLALDYGFKKYIIVVPSVAIREGVIKTLEIAQDHFRAEYNNLEYEYFLYDSTKPGRLRNFATSNKIQIMVINIDAFRKDFSDSDSNAKSNVIFKESDKLSGRKPIEFVQATKPIVIIDEPQSVDNTLIAQKAIKSLKPSLILRYSATHKNPYNVVYKLDPIRAFELGLVKQIVVASVTGEHDQNDAFVKLIKVENKSGIKAQIEIQVYTSTGIKNKKITVKQGADLYMLSDQRDVYKEGYEITEISAEEGNEFIEFSLRGRLNLGQEIGGIKNDLSSVQIRNTIKKHLDKELQVRGKGIKVLSLFFIDKVANYRKYDEEGKSVGGKFAQMFEQEYKSLLQLPQYKELNVLEVSKVHDGYFSSDKKGVFKDTKGTTQADDDTYSKIMRNKEQLLSLDEPLKFIFSHSALREGWDNPNVFQICTLNETESIIKKRQEIGRGLRLPVNQNGERIFDKNINKLTIIANESYDSFAKKLQTEYENDCGVTFGKVTNTLFAQLVSTDTKEKIGKDKSDLLFRHLVYEKILDESGKITIKFTPEKDDFDLHLPEIFVGMDNDVIALLDKYKMERHIQRDEVPRKAVFKKEIELDEDFKTLWEKIKQKTTYRVHFDTQELIQSCVAEIKNMPTISATKIIYKEGEIELEHGGLQARETRVSTVNVTYNGPMPDIISYLQRSTELTRKTIVEILKQSNRLQDFITNPQRFMDTVKDIIKTQLNKVIIDGIQYEKIDNAYYAMKDFQDVEIITYLSTRLEVKKSVYDVIKYDSEIERRFAGSLDKRDDIKLFVKLPSWFQVDTPVGKYNPDWAIVKQDEDKIYLIAETKGSTDMNHLRNNESSKVKCGARHFKSLDVIYKVVVGAEQV